MQATQHARQQTLAMHWLITGYLVHQCFDCLADRGLAGLLIKGDAKIDILADTLEIIRDDHLFNARQMKTEVSEGHGVLHVIAIDSNDHLRLAHAQILLQYVTQPAAILHMIQALLHAQHHVIGAFQYRNSQPVNLPRQIDNYLIV